MAKSVKYRLFPVGLGAIFCLCSLQAADQAGFDRIVVPFLDNYCLDCHDEETQEGKLSLEAVDADFYDASKMETWRMIYDQLHFLEMPPPRKKNQPTAEERQTVLKWIRREIRSTQLPGRVADPLFLQPKFGNYVDHEALFDKRLDRVYPSPPRLWRLRTSIYDRIVPSLSPGERVTGLANGLGMLDGSDFKDFASTYFIDEASTAPLLGNAKKVATALLAPKSRDKTFKALVEAQAPDDNSVTAAIRLAFQRMLGRNPVDEEAERFRKFYLQAKSTGGHKPAAKALLTAVLMQPEFLFRQELGDGKVDEFGRMRLSQSELAYALSYALNNRPAEEFLKAAENGKLSNSDQVAEAVRQRLKAGDNPRLMQFFREYFHYPFSTEVFKDNPPHVEYKSSMLVSDLEFTIQGILKQDKHVLKRLLTTREYHVNVKIETKNGDNKGQLIPAATNTRHYQTIYGLPMDWKWSTEAQPVKFRADERAGVLTHPAWLTAWSGNFDNHPVQRGLWVRTHLLGGSVPDVPIGVDARVPEIPGLTFRDRLKVATGEEHCWRCHRNMDPLGVPFEQYDHYGRVQRKDAGLPVETTGKIDRTMFPELHRDVVNPTEMMDFLAESPRVEQVFVRHAFRYFMGRNETLGDANTLQDAHRAYRDSDGSFNTLVVSLLASDSFALRSAPKDAK